MKTDREQFLHDITNKLTAVKGKCRKIYRLLGDELAPELKAAISDEHNKLDGYLEEAFELCRSERASIEKELQNKE